MSAQSKIEWCDRTFNPWIGCTKVSPGCANCYAEGEDKRRGWTPAGWGKGKPRKRTSAANWKLPLRWNRALALCEQCAQPKTFQTGMCPNCGTTTFRRQRVFCASLADWLDDAVPIEWLADLLALIHATPNLDWLLLTKRPENWYHRLWNAALYVRDYHGHNQDWLNFISNWVQWDKPPDNVWVGTSVEDQQRADERIPKLLEIPAKVRFLSCEPLLGPLNLKHLAFGWHTTGNNFPAPANECSWDVRSSPRPKIDWVIIGGESGPKSRPCNIEWIRDLVRQCREAGVAPFVKQLGAKPRIKVRDKDLYSFIPFRDKKGGNPSEWPADLRVREFPSTVGRSE